MDIELAGEMDGIDAARRIIKSRDIPVVFLTANTSGKLLIK
jgi:CheY-like chemotaxis protein